MDRSLIDDEDFPLSRKSVLPGEGFFIPDEIHERERKSEAADALADASATVVADPDADGLASVALLRAAVGDLALLPTGPHDLADGFDRVAAHANPGVTLFVCDLVPDAYDDIAEPLKALIEDGTAVTWFDHHQWSADVEAAVRAAGVDLTVGDSDRECTADVVIRAADHDFPEHLRELAIVTRDHDLWLKEDPRSDDLADFAYWAEPEEYVDTVHEHGPDLPSDIEAFLAERREEKDALIDRAVDRARFVEVGSYTVGVTYGRCSQNEVAEALRQAGADASVVVKPSGSASLRGTDDFQRCHEVAALVGGGGHPKAAGCKPDIYADMLDFARHWVTEGAITQRAILDAFEAVVRDERN